MKIALKTLKTYSSTWNTFTRKITNSFSIILLSLPILPKVVLYHIHSAVCYTEGVCPSLYIYFSRLLNQFMTCAPLTTGVNWKAAVFKRTFLAFLCLSVHIMRCLLLGSMRGFLVTEYPSWRGVQVKHQREDRPTGYILKLKLSSTQVLTGSEWIDLEPDVSTIVISKKFCHPGD